VSTIFDGLNDAQREAASHVDGPLLVIAGPGSGKTHTLVRRALFLVETGHARPEEIVLCTFTEKAALELRDRTRSEAAKHGITADLSGILIGTIHGIASQFLEKYRHKTPLGNNFTTLDDLTKKLFINDIFDQIVDGFASDPDGDGRQMYFGKWATKWSTIAGLTAYFDRIAEEMIDLDKLKNSQMELVRSIAVAYERYRAALISKNAVDFAHLQVFFFDLLTNTTEGDVVRRAVKFVMVDEYQDTNYVQEQLVLQLASETNNICVVGDEDQALYRFRGATVRNILEFPHRLPGCKRVILSVNYRSHDKIVAAYDAYMKAHDWKGKDGRDFRFAKTIQPDPTGKFPSYPSVLRVSADTKDDEANLLADFVVHLRDNEIIEDLSQVAVLLRSVKWDHSGPYIEALHRRGIKTFCPRARAFFGLPEVQLIMGTIAVVLNYVDGVRPDNVGRAVRDLHDYLDECIAMVAEECDTQPPLAEAIRVLHDEIAGLGPGDTLDRRISDYVYETLAVAPFVQMLSDPNAARSLAMITQLLGTFQKFYNYTVITGRNIEGLRRQLYLSFFRLLYEGGINEYEDPDQPFPRDHVSINTIHQSKGLEFPVTIVGSLSGGMGSGKEHDRNLGPYYHRAVFEPEKRITGFDRMRLHYVAFSRAQRLLVLTHDLSKAVRADFSPIWDLAAPWSAGSTSALVNESWGYSPKLPPKKPYSFTGDLKVYETCPRQYQMYRLLDFEPSRAVVIMFGLLVHQTIEDLHRMVLEGRGDEVDETFITDRFEFNYRHLVAKATRRMAEAQKGAALAQVLNYWRQNTDAIARVQETEVDVSLEKDDYILHGAIDLVLGDAGTLEVLDFKAQTRPPDDAPMIATYYKQLCIYAHILEERKGLTPSKLHIYWTGEPSRDRALMTFDFDRNDVDGAASHFENVVRAIQREQFNVITVPEPKVCDECDFKPYCESVGTIAKSKRGRRRS